MKKRCLLALVAVVVVVSVWRGRHTAEPAGERLFADRLWIDHVPRGETDTVQVFVALSREAIGLFQASSMWRGGFEAFRFEAVGKELRVLYPQTGKREAARVHARRCDEQGMDYCLDVDGASRGVKRYYSLEGWEIDGVHDVDALAHRVDALRAELAAQH